MIILVFGVTAKFCSQFFAGFGRGFCDGAVSKFSDADVSLAKSVVDVLEHCEPWSQHLTAEGITKMHKAINKGNDILAKSIVDKSLTGTHAPWCIDILKAAIVLVCSGGPKIVKEALPQTFY